MSKFKTTLEFPLNAPRPRMDSIHSFGNGFNVYWRKKGHPCYIAALLMRESDTLKDGTIYLEAWEKKTALCIVHNGRCGLMRKQKEEQLEFYTLKKLEQCLESPSFRVGQSLSILSTVSVGLLESFRKPKGLSASTLNELAVG